MGHFFPSIELPASVLLPYRSCRTLLLAAVFLAGNTGATTAYAQAVVQSAPERTDIEEAPEEGNPAKVAERPAADSKSPGARSTARGLLAPIVWSPSYRRVGWLDYTLTGVGTAASIIARVIGPPSDGPRGGVWFDEEARDALRAQGVNGRILAADTSDVLLGLSSSYALVGDPLVNAVLLRDSPEVGVQLAWINAEVIALTLGIQQTTANISGRERPYGRTCGTADLDEDTHACAGSDRYRSFFSGHTSVPFSIAAATCVNHIYLPLSGGHAWVPCTAGFVMATGSGLLRIVSDNHYATDVMTGALLGTTVGLAVPLIHYTTGFKPPTGQLGGATFTVLPLFGLESQRPLAGLSISGVLR